MTDVVQKLWGFCHTLRHDGIDYGDYIEQITYLLFLKMADERKIAVPVKCDWQTLRKKSGTELTDHYVDVLRTLGKERGILGDIYAGAQSRFNNPVNLKRLIELIDETEWTALDVDVKAAAYEGLLEKAADEGKKGAGQYFTPRILIKTIVRVMQPDPRIHKKFTICDPACGTGGFLVAAYEWLMGQTRGVLDREVAKRVKTGTYFGQDLVARPRRLALMNLYLHGLEPHIGLGDSIYEVPSGRRYDVVLTNPPFGTKGANQAPDRDDFVIATGETHCVREFLELAFGHVGLPWQDFVEIDPRYYRPSEVDLLLGDASKAQAALGWRPVVCGGREARREQESDQCGSDRHVRS